MALINVSNLTYGYEGSFDNIFEKVCEYDDQIMKYNINIQETTNKINSLVNRFKSLQEMYK